MRPRARPRIFLAGWLPRLYSQLMARTPRAREDGLVYHVLNRGNGRRAFLHKPGDFEAWLRVLAEAKKAVPMRVLAYCLMPNHWHLVLWPEHGQSCPGSSAG